MAEIIRVRQTHTRQSLLRDDLGEQECRTTEAVTVRSIRAGVVDVSILRNLVAALDAAEVPGRALVSAERSSEGHLVQLTVRHEVDIVPADGEAGER